MIAFFLWFLFHEDRKRWDKELADINNLKHVVDPDSDYDDCDPFSLLSLLSLDNEPKKRSRYRA